MAEIRTQTVADYNEGDCLVCGKRVKLNAIITREYNGHTPVGIVHWECGLIRDQKDEPNEQDS